LNAELTCVDIPCDRDCGYSEWSAWGDCTNLMGGVMKRFRSANEPEARGEGEPCDESPENLVEEAPCGDNETCVTCLIDGKEWAVSEVVSEEPCGQVCFCNMDGELQCKDNTPSCGECPEGYVREPDAQDCCRCVQVEEICSLVRKTEVISFDMEDENGAAKTCISETEIELTTCEGSCPSSQGPMVMMADGKATFQNKDCKCCSGRVAEEIEIELLCDNVPTPVTIQRYDQCECEVCSAREDIFFPNP